MATTYTRRINLYINGQEVRNDIASITAEFKKASNQLNRMKLDSAEYQQQLKKVGQLKSIMDDHRKSIAGASAEFQKQPGMISGVIDKAKGLLGAFGWAAIAGAAVAAFTKMKNSTDALSDLWDEVMGAMTGATNYFWTTLASGDWSNFFTNIKEAARLGREYAKTLDFLGDRQRALSIEEADAEQQILALEEKMRNKTLSTKERREAGQERIRLEEELAASRTKNAELAFKNEVENNFKFNKLGKDRTLQLLTDLESQERAEAEAFNKKVTRVEELQKLQKIQNSPQAAGTTIDFNIDPEEIRRLNEEIGNTPAAVKEYAGALNEFEKATEEERDRVVKTYSDLKKAENSAAANTKRVRTMVNSLLAAESAEAEKQYKENLKTLVDANKDRTEAITKQHDQEHTSDLNFKLQMAVAERQFLEDKKKLHQKYGKSTLEIDKKLGEQSLEQIIEQDKELANLMANIHEKVKDGELDKGPSIGKKPGEYGLAVKDPLTEAEKFAETEEEKLAILKEKLEEGKIAQKEYEEEVTRIHEEAERKRQEATDKRFRIAQDLTNMASDLVNSMMELELEKAGDNEEKKNAIRKKYANLTFTASVAKIVVDTAGAIMKGYEQLGPIAGSVAAALLAATGAVQIGIANQQRSKMVNGMAEGGYTGPGGKYEPAGIVHRGEWVAPQELVRNPATAGIIAALENVRRNRVSINPALTNGSVSLSSGGYASGKSAINSDANMTAMLDRFSAALEENTTATRQLMQWKPKVYTEMIKKDLDTLDHINRNRNL